MKADLGSPRGQAGPRTLASPDMSARNLCSLIPGCLPRLLSLTWLLPARHTLTLLPVLPRPATGHF
jgi:hypothetical protein